MDAGGVLVTVALAAILFLQAGQGLERHGPSIATIAVAVLAAGGLILLLMKAGRRRFSVWAA
ncbi:hypothetical protein GTY86_00700, partial [Streptomyces sp. SID5770]|uniref:hypothetical protein n=1 Tax=Streptomyces sp. SID5770 TaxID=2690308 RepID=UPI00138448A1